jgi:hypothetical protein
MTPIRELFGIAGYVIEAVGVIIIIVGIVLSAIWFVGRLRRLKSLDAYQQFRQDLARSIILGLEFLIAGDIIRTVTVDPTPAIARCCFCCGGSFAHYFFDSRADWTVVNDDLPKLGGEGTATQGGHQPRCKRKRWSRRTTSYPSSLITAIRIYACWRLTGWEGWFS